jgi:hypothetical protein
MGYPIDKVRERYLHDAMFHAMVECIRAAIIRMQLTASEVREAAMLACIIEEERRPVAYSPAELEYMMAERHDEKR